VDCVSEINLNDDVMMMTMMMMLLLYTQMVVLTISWLSILSIQLIEVFLGLNDETDNSMIVPKSGPAQSLDSASCKPKLTINMILILNLTGRGFRL